MRTQRLFEALFSTSWLVSVPWGLACAMGHAFLTSVWCVYRGVFICYFTSCVTLVSFSSTSNWLVHFCIQNIAIHVQNMGTLRSKHYLYIYFCQDKIQSLKCTLMCMYTRGIYSVPVRWKVFGLSVIIIPENKFFFLSVKRQSRAFGVGSSLKSCFQLNLSIKMIYLQA